MNGKPPEVLYYAPGYRGTRNPHGLYISLKGILSARKTSWEARWRDPRIESDKRVWRAKSIVWEEIEVD